jgi:hypothetical protein
VGAARAFAVNPVHALPSRIGHVDQLKFIDIMLDDQPATDRLSANANRGPHLRPSSKHRAYLKEGTVITYYEEILIGALRLAQADAEQGRLDDVRLENIFKTVSDFVEDLGEHGNGASGAKAKRVFP